MKQRFSSLDVKVIAHELNDQVVPLRLANIYDLSTKILLFKFAKPDIKKQLLLDVGFRCHLTEFTRTTSGTPSAFVAKLRKLLKTRRLTSVSQVGTDRIIEFQFSDGQYRVFLEFFASGNIIVTNSNLEILALSRNVTEGESQEIQRVGLKYSLENRQNFAGIPPLTRERLRGALLSSVERSSKSDDINKKLRIKPGGDLRKCLAVSITELPPVLVDHILQVNDFDTATKPAFILDDEPLFEALLHALSAARTIVENINSVKTCPGFIFAKSQQVHNEDVMLQSQSRDSDDLLYEDFQPFIPKKFSDSSEIKILRFDGFNRAVDHFFSSLEGQRLENRIQERQFAASKKLAAAKRDQAYRIEGLQETQSLNLRKAAAIEANIERVQEAIDAVRSLLTQGMDWEDIGKLIQREKTRQNPVANMICLPLRLQENTITLVLDEGEEEVEDDANDPLETDSESETDQSQHVLSKSMRDMNKVTVDILLTLSPWGNAREYYDERKSAVVKEEKTKVQAAKAIRSTEEKIQADLTKVLKLEKDVLQPLRVQAWFEKFFWFISSDGYLVLGGKDAAQGELIYRKHLHKGDIYCTADLKDASVVVIKNIVGSADAPIPPTTLSQAGILAVSSSEAWDSKAGVGAWWVKADQVSKVTTDGEVLPLGVFHISGEPNHLPPGQLLLGLGLMFEVTRASKSGQLKSTTTSDTSESAAVIKSEDLLEPDMLRQHLPSGIQPVHEGLNSLNLDASYKQDDTGRDHPPRVRADRLTPVLHVEKDGRDGLLQSPISSEQINAHINTPSKSGEHHNSISATSDPHTSRTDTSTGPDLAPTMAAAGSREEQENVQLKRGQKSKAKKKATKYRNQDEEDRLAAEALIGAGAGARKAEAEAKAKADRELEINIAKARRRAQQLRVERETIKHEEKRRTMMELEDQEQEANTFPLDTLVGTPRYDDEIVSVVVVCAPFAALGKVKYKAKLQPGPLKKGKAVKEVLERWKAESRRKKAVDEQSRDNEKMWPREIELIGTLRAEEMVNTIPAGKLKVLMPGSGGGRGTERSQGRRDTKVSGNNRKDQLA